VGLCGSGILDALAELLKHGAVDRRGRLKADHPRVRTIDTGREFVLVSVEERNGRPALGLTQQDIRQLQLAKAAIESGIHVLLEHSGMVPGQLASVIVAGAFGTYLDLKSADAAGAGAKLALTSTSLRNKSRSLARSVGYVELATAPGFMKRFVESTYLAPFESNGG
jgi:uncharacterized 2Fe-2S/4Fe-4S cluster protein (DUF4445 family)